MSHTLPPRGVFTQALINAKARGSKRHAIAQGYSGVVTNSYELARILDVPRRKLDLESVIDLTPVFRKEGGTMKLRPIQSAALMEAHHANGLFAPVSVGGGKCVSAHTFVMDSKQGRRHIKDIGQFKTLAQKEGKLGWHQATSMLSGEKECARLTLTDGQEIEASLDHPFLTQRGWVELRDLHEDDLVATARHYPDFEADSSFSDDEVALSAFLLADGGLTHHVQFVDDNETVLAEVARLVDELCNGSTRSPEKSAAFRLSIRGGKEFLSRVGITQSKSKDKELPSEFFLMSRSQIALFLNRFWACDGHLSEKTAECTLASKRLVRDLQWLLKRLAIRSSVVYKEASIGEKKYDAWRLSFSGKDYIRFLEVVGPIFGQEEKHRAILENKLTKKANTNVDVVPIGVEEIKEICDELGMPGRGGCYKKRALYTGRLRTEVKKFTGVTTNQRLSREKFAAFCEEFDYRGKYAWLATSDLCWERIRSVEHTGMQPVYDLTVPTAKNFVADGMVVHNTLVSLLVPEAMDSERAVLLVPPQLRDQLAREIDEVYGKHFNLPLERIVRVVAYSELSLAKNSELLDELEPDLIVADECHLLRRPQSARTKRFTRYMRENPQCRLVALSGTVTTRSILEYAHLLELCLRKNSLLPNGYRELQDWSGALDVTPAKLMAPGALMKFCEGNETARQGYRRRLVETQGVVATAENELGTSLYIKAVRTIVPNDVAEALNVASQTWAYEEEEFSSPLELARFLRQVACGFYYRWVWPDGEPDYDWLEARKEWKKAVREKIKLNQPGLDSELLCANAAERWREKTYEGKEFRAGTKFFECPEWVTWKEFKTRFNPTPPTEAVWISDFLVKDTIRRVESYLSKKRKCIVWYQHKVLGEAIAEASGWAHFGAGTDASASKEKVIIASIDTQGTGKNLQHYDTNIITSLPPNGKTFEQLAGRTHRPGQLADEVIVDYFAHTGVLEAAMEAVIADAKYIQETTGQKQKVLYASVLTPEKRKTNGK